MTGMDPTLDQHRLADRMSALSEECWAASWMAGTEFDVWALLVGDRTAWGMCDWAEDHHADALAEIRRLSEATGSWIVWDDTHTEPSEHHIWLRAVVPLDEWKRRYAERRAAEGGT